MREGQPRRSLERQRPEGVGQDWLTKEQAKEVADIRSERAFRLLVEVVRAQDSTGIVEEGPSKPTWVSPDFAAKLKEQNSIPEAEDFMHAAKEAAKKIPCNHETFTRLTSENGPDPNNSAEIVAIRRAGNGAKVPHYSDAYIDALARIYKAEQEAREEASLANQGSMRYTAGRQAQREAAVKRAVEHGRAKQQPLTSPDTRPVTALAEMSEEERKGMIQKIAEILPQLSMVISNASGKDKAEMVLVRSKLLGFERLLAQGGQVNSADVQEQIDEAQYHIDEA